MNLPCFLFGERTILFCDLLPPEVAIEEIEQGDVKRVNQCLGCSNLFVNNIHERVPVPRCSDHARLYPPPGMNRSSTVSSAGESTWGT